MYPSCHEKSCHKMSVTKCPVAKSPVTKSLYPSLETLRGNIDIFY